MPNAVLVRDIPGFCNLDHVFYTDFNAAGKIAIPDPINLANAAIKSVAKAIPGQDGISYLLAIMDAGVETALTQRYCEEILQQCNVTTLNDALEKVKNKSY